MINIQAEELTDQLDYVSMIKEITESFVVMSDSGGLQEEVPYLGRPLIVLRNVTERPEIIESGSAILGGTGKEKGKRHPTIGNNVTIAAGAKVLGNIKIGDNVNIGAGSVVIRDVPSYSTVVGVPGRVVKHRGKKVLGITLDHGNLPDPILERLQKFRRELNEIEKAVNAWKEESLKKET